jgi:hypothetical protein
MTLENSQSAVDAWKRTISFYEDSIEHGFDFAPLLSLVKQMAESPYSRVFYPFTSHFALCISATDDYQIGLKRPMLTVEYLIEENVFRVQYLNRPHQTHDLERVRCHASQVWPLLQGMFLRLDLESCAAEAEQSSEADKHQGIS